MATNTEHFNFVKPDGTESADQDIYNDNLDAIDEEIASMKPKQTAKSSPSASGSAAAFIDAISQDANGVITATKKNVYGDGINMSSSDTTKVSSAIAAKLAKTEVYNGLNKTEAGFALDARMGKALSDGKVEYYDTIVSNMNSTPITLKPYVGRWAGANTSNAPIGNSQGVYIGFASSANYQTQIAISNAGSVWVRKQTEGTWDSWKRTDLLGSDIAIVANGDAAPRAITSGQYVIWNGSLYTAIANIASGGALSNANLQAVSIGGLNSLANSIEKHDIWKINTSINATDSTSAYRLANQWSSFLTYLRDLTGKTSGFANIDGTIAFPAYSGANNLGSFWIYGMVGLNNGAGTVVLTQYHSGSLFVIRYHTDDTYDIYMQPTVKMFTVAKASPSTFTIANNSRIKIDFFGGSNNLPGSAWISCTSSGGISKQQTAASEISITTAANAITITNSAANAATPIYCTIYDGNISEQT